METRVQRALQNRSVADGATIAVGYLGLWAMIHIIEGTYYTSNKTGNVEAKARSAVVADDSGRYSAKVPAGFYDVFVSAMAFTPAATKVRVKEGQPTTCAQRF
jgi:hypothetical protein